MKLKHSSRMMLPRAPVGSALSERVGPCPVCGRLVRVGGPYQNCFILLPHAPLPGGIVSCTGTDQQIDAAAVVPPL